MGDVLLGNDPIDNNWGRLFGPAVRLTGTEQHYDEVSAVQNFMLGSAMKVDERVYHYARAGAALVAPCTYRLAVNADLQAPTTWGMALNVAIVAGDRTCTITPGAGYGEVPNTVGLNELVGGWIEIWGPANLFMWRRIIGNTAILVGVPATMVITVDRPFNGAVPAAAGVAALHRSIYRNVQTGGVYPGVESAVGLPPVPVPINNFFWLQTWGPSYIASQIGNPGAVVGFRDVYLGVAGTVASFNLAYAAGANVSPQHVGYIMGASTLGDGNNDVMLQLAP
jgi:hypothetical protein